MATKKTTKATKATMAAEVPATSQETRYTKSALASSRLFEGRRDLLTVILEDGKSYTIDEAEKAIKNYLNKEV